MRLLDVYSSWQKKEITDKDMADALDLSEKDFKFRITRWGARLPLLLDVLDKIRAGQMTRPHAALALQVSERQVNHLMKTWSVVRPIPSYLVESATAQVKWEIRKKYAIEYIAGSSTIEEAAEGAQVSTRQIRRWVSELLQKHFEMMFKDLRELTDPKRKRLADEIEIAEGLELSKQSVIRSISTGAKSIEDEALERVLNRRKYRGLNVRPNPQIRPKPAK